MASAERAVALGPSDAEAQVVLSLVLTSSGRHAEAVAAIETAMRLNPSLPASDRIVAGLAFLLNDQPERAIEMLERARAEAPNVEDIHGMLTAAYARAGRMDAARRAVAEALRVAPGLCVEQYRVVLANFRRDQDRAKILDAMIAGGMPQWPYGFSADLPTGWRPPRSAISPSGGPGRAASKAAERRWRRSSPMARWPFGRRPTWSPASPSSSATCCANGWKPCRWAARSAARSIVARSRRARTTSPTPTSTPRKSSTSRRSSGA